MIGFLQTGIGILVSTQQLFQPIQAWNQQRRGPMETFEKVAQLFQSKERAVEVANRFDRAYYEGTGTRDGHVPFNDPEMVAMNLAGLYAADGAAALLALDGRLGAVEEDNYVNQLRRIAGGDLSDPEKAVVCLAANLTWRAGQPFRGITSDPLGRITRGVNQPWAALERDEQLKDLVQVQLGARIILENLEG
jgi:hypothetical protein